MKHLITLLLFVAGGTFTPAVSAETAEYLNIIRNVQMGLSDVLYYYLIMAADL